MQEKNVEDESDPAGPPQFSLAILLWLITAASIYLGFKVAVHDQSKDGSLLSAIFFDLCVMGIGLFLVLKAE